MSNIEHAKTKSLLSNWIAEIGSIDGSNLISNNFLKNLFYTL